ncbi:uroporphyrinogen-III synthase [Thiopseudomonas denitrificans]|uniref:Uroporphyrinogen-III synthase n=1 Tax=Thiopseudomonas denitrificans TaxID=1501432 RepID=A0A4R6TZD7_9GAMM|nr:uroporphyrinogen-III synthase [Thiopseudomonas denitrificans]
MVATWRVLITRPAADNAVLGQLLGGYGIYSHGMPLLDMQPLPETPQQRQILLELDRYSTVVVVSKPAARYMLQRLDQYWPQPPLRPQWFTVGAASGEILADYGLNVCWPTTGDDSEALLALPGFERSLQQPGPRVLVVRADQGREFLAQSMAARGIIVDFLPLYQRFMPEYPDGVLLQAVSEHALNGLVVSSEQGLHNLIRLAGPDWATLCRLPLFVPSPRVAQTARDLGARQVIDCQGASNQALLAALQRNAPAQP